MKKLYKKISVLTSIAALSIVSIQPANAQAIEALASFLYEQGVFNYAAHSASNQCRSLERYNRTVNMINNANTETGANALEDYINASDMQKNCVRSIYGGDLAGLWNALNAAQTEYVNKRDSGVSSSSSNKICLKTRRGHTLNAHDSAGNVSAIPTGNCTDLNASDEIFTIDKVNGSGTINSGDKVCLKTRRGHTLNAHDSAGNVSAIPTGNCTDLNASDEIFTIHFL